MNENDPTEARFLFIRKANPDTPAELVISFAGHDEPATVIILRPSQIKQLFNDTAKIVGGSRWEEMWSKA